MFVLKERQAMAFTDRVERDASQGPGPAEDATHYQQNRIAEDQLARIITAARHVAIVAEELLREISQRNGAVESSPHALAMAPRLLAATEQQLNSVAAMLRQN
jgi:hypothetical protein